MAIISNKFALCWWLSFSMTLPVISQDYQTCLADGTCTTTAYNRQEKMIPISDLYDENGDDYDPDLAEYEREQEERAKCQDFHENCGFWASIGECTKNPGYMNVNCRNSCRLCLHQVLTPELRKLQEEQGADLGVPQQLDFTTTLTTPQEMKNVLLNARQYMQNVVPYKFERGVQDLCKNEHEQCTFWAAVGECEKNPNYMKKTCGPVCQSCEMVTIEGRCPIDPDAPNAWAPGDLNKMFEKLTSEPYLSRHSVTILSQPLENDDQDDNPWIITMEDVVTEEEAKRLIELGGIEGYQRSSDVGQLKADGSYEKSINSGRTSTNAWCQHDCYKDNFALAAVERLSNLTDIPEINSEYLQLLQYEPGQFYQTHHDYIPHQLKRQEGVRILTVYLYLNDVEEGGGTNFPQYDITVMPKRGRALLWPSVLNDDPDTKDPRTTHQALPVIQGVKYGANAWFHMRDFKTPNANGCQ